MTADHLARERHQRWGAQTLWAKLAPLLPGLSVEVLARAASTNSELLDRARIAAPAPRAPADDSRDAAGRVGRRHADTQPCLLVAESQTAGRGRTGRDWRASPGASLTFSLALPLAPRDWSGLSLVVGVALAEALQARGEGGALRLGVKWPNDLWLIDPESGAAGGRKLGGVLIETLAAGSQRLAVIGVGINVAPLPGPLPAEMQDHIACLREVEPRASAPDALARVALPLVQALKTFEREGFGAFAERFATLDILRGERITTTAPRAPNGIARGVDGQGGLRVETAGGLHVISSGEVSVRPALGASA
jgi:BirA family biotin operon repressor/biotin-[acetyl-CoA-carboxylase] ligase